MTSWKRARQVIAGAAMMAGFAAQGLVPAAAQQSGSADTANPPRGLDFRLPPADDGRDSNVQGPSDNGLPPAPRASTPVVTPRPDVPQIQPKSAPILTAPRAAPAPAPIVPKAVVTQEPKAATPAPRSGSTRPAASAAENTASPANEMPGTAEIPVPMLPGAGPTEDVAPREVESPADDDAPVAVSDAADSDTPWWAWVLAGLMAVFAGVFYWRRQHADDRLDAPVVLSAPKSTGPVSPAGSRPVAAKTPVAPKEDMPKPAVARAQTPVSARPISPVPASRAAMPPVAPQPRAAADAFITASPLVRRPADELRADVAMDVAVRSIRIEADHVAVGFLLTLSNRGMMDATGLMVRIALGQGSAMNEVVLGRFYDGAGGSVLRDDIDLVAGRSEQLSSEVKLPRDSIEPLMMAGKPMMVPVLAADVTYHWDGTGDAFGQIATAYVLGRAAVGGSDKLAPIPLDHVPLAVDRPGARATTIRRRQ